MKAIFSCLVFLIGSQICFSQDNLNSPTDQRAQSIFLEFLGNGLVLSINYDTRLARKQNGLGARIGLGYLPGVLGDGGGISIPFGINYLFGQKNSYLELGAGGTIYSLKEGTELFDNAGISGVLFVPSIGYRYQQPKNGLTGRIFISPLFDKSASQLWAGLSIGYKF